MNVQLKHTLAVDKNAWFIRFYAWLWSDNLDNITFCKLFWGYVAAPLALLVLVFLRPFVAAYDAITSWQKRAAARRAARETKPAVPRTPKPPKPPKPPSPFEQRLLSAIETFGARLVMAATAAAHAVAPAFRLVGRVIRSRTFGRVMVLAGACVGVAFIGAIIWGIVLAWPVARWILAGAGGLLLIVGVVYIMFRKGFDMIAAVVVPAVEGLIDAIDRAGRWVEDRLHIARGVDKGVMGFAAVMKAGYVAVKSNTCPRIEVTGRDSSRK